MRRVLVAKHNGKRIFNWPAVLFLGLILGLVGGASAAGTWWVLTGEFNVQAVLLPLFVGIGAFAGIAIRAYISTPLDNLPELD